MTKLEFILEDINLEYIIFRCLSNLYQTHRTFLDFYPKFKLTARKTPYHEIKLK